MPTISARSLPVHVEIIRMAQIARKASMLMTMNEKGWDLRSFIGQRMVVTPRY
jgi:hypothetical protein